tara:strand:- start:21200 stop:21475 length:276 start_codon:yes stop_codon:yes gene_type:complete
MERGLMWEPDKVAIVEWVDVEDRTSPGWVDSKTARKDSKKPFSIIRTVGFIIENNDEMLSLASTWGPDTSGVLNLPKGVIRAIQIVDASVS